MTTLITGTAGFIGFHLARRMLNDGTKIIGVDNLNDYYDPALKQSRLAELETCDDYTHHTADIADDQAMATICKKHQPTRIIHLAAQAGVAYSTTNPLAYGYSNLLGHTVMLECARQCQVEHFVYASSSSVYGLDATAPFATSQAVQQPASLYAATKRANELMSFSYSNLYQLPATGLRFFTAYGPYGRPDMAYYRFADAIMNDQPITLYEGTLERDFTYIDDIVDGILAAANTPSTDDIPHRVFNLGNNKPEPVSKLIRLLEDGLGKKAIIESKPRPAYDLESTCADITDSQTTLGYAPKTSLEDGIAQFVEWYKSTSS